MWCLPPGNCPACPYGLTFRNCLWMWANICMKTIVSFHTKDENNISSELLSIPFSIFCTRACLKKAFCKMCVTICGIFCPDEGAVAGYGNRIRVKYTAKWGVQIAGMIFQTRSKVTGGCCSHTTIPRGVLAWTCQNPETYKPKFHCRRQSAFYKLIFISLYNKIIADI